MCQLEKSQITSPKTHPDDVRLGQLFEKNILGGSKPRAVLLGFPSDEGVRRNGGRPGASGAPDAVRRQLYKMTPSAEYFEPFTELAGKISDVGNLKVSGDLTEDQQKLGLKVADYLDKGVIPIILGGGHETAYGHFLGYVEAELNTSILNIDAHTDVRVLKEGKPHSGSPFRQALQNESGCAEMYLVAGLQPHSVARSHLDYIEKHNGHYIFRDETNITSISGLFNRHNSQRLMVTFDMDAVDQSQAPGVSAPCANGLPTDLWLTAAYLAGRNEQVTSFDLSEVNPEYDRDNQTTKLAALTIWHFLLGLSQR